MSERERFVEGDDGREVRLGPAEVALLRDLATQVEAVVTGPATELGASPVRDRLFPRAYDDPTEDEAETDWQTASHPDLVRGKSEGLSALLADLDGARGEPGGPVVVALTDERLEGWVGALNDLRLALAVSIGLTDEHQEVSDGDPLAPMFDAYHWLTWFQGACIEALVGDLGL
ncbi:MAG: DUF2017 family protein [Actinobacteria bacterium]|nr:DUF2017 family protein [Actinomycetota bacterium]